MRTNIDIDDALLAEATRLSGLPTKKAVVEEGLRKLIRLKRQSEAFDALWGMGWDGDLDALRTDECWGHAVDESDNAPKT